MNRKKSKKRMNMPMLVNSSFCSCLLFFAMTDQPGQSDSQPSSLITQVSTPHDQPRKTGPKIATNAIKA